jgi:hypothetical protein
VLLNWQVPATHAAAAWHSASVKSGHGGGGVQTGCRLAAAASYAAKLASLMAENTGTQSASTLQLRPNSEAAMVCEVELDPHPPKRSISPTMTTDLAMPAA